MSRLRVLLVAHNHPDLHPGGSEIFAHDLFAALKQGGEVETMFLACTNAVHRAQKPGTAFQTVGRSADEALLWAGHFDHFFQSQIDLHGVVPELGQLLRSFRPDVVHFHHSLLIGVEAIHLVRRTLPDARIVFTLHDYYAICPNHGQMVKAGSHALCDAAGIDACGKCFPEIGADKLVLRRQHIRNMFRLVDRFVTPSAFLRRRYLEWGLEPDHVGVLANGRPAAAVAPPETPRQGPVSFGYFGNLSPFKGVMVALEAARILAGEGRDFRLQIHGGMPFQSETFRTGFDAALRDTAPQVAHFGPYRAAAMPALLHGVDWVVMPSIWWENAPLVIQEAFQQKRPVICSGIGGMAEMVEDGVSGLHFPVGNAAGLAAAMRRALDEPALRQRLAAAIPTVPTIAETARAHLALYRGLGRMAAAARPAA